MKTLNYSTLTLNDLEEIFDIKREQNKKIFDKWFLQKYNISEEENLFLKKLVNRHFDKIINYTELELISKFIAPILNMVDFELKDKKIRDWYEVPLKYEYKNIVFNGRCDYVVARGYDNPINPYFFIQEFKQASSSFPEYQLIAEMIVSTLINKTKTIKGAYIVGSVWTFVILEKIKEDNYRYFISKKYDSIDIDDLTKIYKNLQIVKQEIYKNN